jgi:alpha-N-arabinofuranosidase
VDPTAELVACGYDETWNLQLLESLGKRVSLVDHLSIHRYWSHGGPETSFDDDEYYALLAEAHATESFVQRTAEIIASTVGASRRVGIALDEWGVWHPEARGWPPRGGVEPRVPVTYEQTGTLRDALAAGIALEGFHRQCGVLTLANLAQIVNVLQAVVMTDGPRMWRTPTYWALHLHRPHLGATALPVEIGAADRLPDGSAGATATASRTEQGLAITLINRHLKNPTEVCLETESPELRSARACILSAATPRAANSADQPDVVCPADLPVTSSDPGVWRLDLPPHSMATLVLR